MSIISYAWLKQQCACEFEELASFVPVSHQSKWGLSLPRVGFEFARMMLTFKHDFESNSMVCCVHDTHTRLSIHNKYQSKVFEEHIYTKEECANWFRLVRTWYELSVVPPNPDKWFPYVKGSYYYDKTLNGVSKSRTPKMLVFPQNGVWAIGFGIHAIHNKYKHILTHRDTLDDAQRFVEAWCHSGGPWFLSENPRTLWCASEFKGHEKPEIRYVDGMWRSDLTTPTDDPLMAIRMFEEACNDV